MGKSFSGGGKRHLFCRKIYCGAKADVLAGVFAQGECFGGEYAYQNFAEGAQTARKRRGNFLGRYARLFCQKSRSPVSFE